MSACSLCSSFLRNPFGSSKFSIYLCTVTEDSGQRWGATRERRLTRRSTNRLRAETPLGSPLFPLQNSVGNYCFCAKFANFPIRLTFQNVIMNRLKEFWDTPIGEKFQYVWFLALVVTSVTLILVGLPFVLAPLC